MKNSILFFFLFLSIQAYSQDCSEITKKYDKFKDVTTYSSPGIESGNAKVDLFKSISIFAVKQESKTNKTFSLLFLHVSETLDISGKGVILILENDTKIDQPDAEIERMSSSGSMHIYGTTMQLDQKMVELLIKYKITDVRIFAYESNHNDDFSITDGASAKMIFYLKCLVNNGESSAVGSSVEL